MPRNTTGGSGHKARANAEGNIVKRNRQLVDNFMDDITKEGKCDGVFVSRVTRKLGDGRMEVLYMDGGREVSVPAPIKGSLRGRGKSQAFIEVGTIVLVAETGLTGAMSHEIIGVVTASQLASMKRIMTLDTRIIDGAAKPGETGEFEFGAAGDDDDADVEVDNI